LAIQNFDFELAEKILSFGFIEDIPGKAGFSPNKEFFNKTNVYAIRYINEGKGWQILLIDQGPYGEDKVYE
jgi:hypothetical protein